LLNILALIERVAANTHGYFSSGVVQLQGEFALMTLNHGGDEDSLLWEDLEEMAGVYRPKARQAVPQDHPLYNDLLNEAKRRKLR
jgi:hypothetical protein